MIARVCAINSFMIERVTVHTREDSVRSAPRVQPQAADHLFIALEAERPLAGSTRHSLSNIDEVVIGRGSSRAWQRVQQPRARRLHLSVPDGRMSHTHARLCRAADGAWELLDCESRNGTWQDGVRVKRVVLRDGALFELGRTFFILRSGLETPAQTPGDADSLRLNPADPAFATLLPQLTHDFDHFARVARSRVPVLLLGETGAGKEWLSRALHKLSGREGPFIAVNCAALTATLLESQLFGHVKGAFSGADRNQLGLVRAAEGGTLFLDEIADLPLASQAALLRVLQEHEVTPVGGTQAIAVDVRVVAATHGAIEQLVEQGAFRADLFARLDAFRFSAAPLRERREELGLLIARVFADAPEHAPRALHPDLARALLTYAWPRNIRELRNDLIAAAVLASGDTLRLEHLRKPLASSEPAPVPAQRVPADPLDDLDQQLLDQLQDALQESNGNLSEVARRMGKARTQIQRWMQRFELDRRRFVRR